MRNLKKWVLAATLICGTITVLTSCSDKDDDPVPTNPAHVDFSVAPSDRHNNT